MKRKSIAIFAISFMATILALWGIIWLATSANAGIGPSGFDFYARQGIINENNHVYGKGNSPWIVKCSETPKYHPFLSDTVICKITEKL